jgi:uncharacterized membrane protein YphA (DoxX/SURF4 family)
MDSAVEFTAVGFRFWLAAVFLVAGLSKVGRRREFERAVAGYGLVPAHFAPFIAAALPPLELGGGMLLALGLGVSPAALTLAVLLAIFALAVSANLARGRRIDCGCFGAGIPRTITWRTVARNVTLGAMAVVVGLAAPRAFALDSLAYGPPESSHSHGIAALIASTAVIAIVVLAVEAIRIERIIRRTSQGSS